MNPCRFFYFPFWAFRTSSCCNFAWAQVRSSKPHAGPFGFEYWVPINRTTQHLYNCHGTCPLVNAYFERSNFWLFGLAVSSACTSWHMFISWCSFETWPGKLMWGWNRIKFKKIEKEKTRSDPAKNPFATCWFLFFY